MHRFESYSNETANTALDGRFILDMVSFCLLNAKYFSRSFINGNFIFVLERQSY